MQLHVPRSGEAQRLLPLPPYDCTTGILVGAEESVGGNQKSHPPWMDDQQLYR
jgi:hypothetical protein